MDNEDFNRDTKFFRGKMTHKEHVIWNLQTNSSYKPELSRSLDIDDIGRDPFGLDESVRIIKVNSEPNLRKCLIESCSLDTNDRFLATENEVAQLCKTYRNPDSDEVFNNTLEFVDYILKRGPQSEVKLESRETFDEKKRLSEEKVDTLAKLAVPCETVEPEIVLPTIQKDEKTLTEIKKSPLPKSEQLLPLIGKKLKSQLPCNEQFSPSLRKRLRSPLPINEQSSPSLGKKLRSPLLKYKQVSPSLGKNLKSPNFKMPLPIQNTPDKKSIKRNPLYQHIDSPIAAYIKHSPQVPLVKDVWPMKPLPSTSSTHLLTPKCVKSQMQETPKIVDNIQLPLVAYKSAKKTEVIKVPDDKKLPPSKWVNEFTSKNKPTVIKHVHREMATTSAQAPTLIKEESFVDLPLNQAELSLCKQKSAFKPL